MENKRGTVYYPSHQSVHPHTHSLKPMIYHDNFFAIDGSGENLASWHLSGFIVYPIHSLTHSLNSFTHFLTHSLTRSLTHSPIHSLNNHYPLVTFPVSYITAIEFILILVVACSYIWLSITSSSRYSCTVLIKGRICLRIMTGRWRHCWMRFCPNLWHI